MILLYSKLEIYKMAFLNANKISVKIKLNMSMNQVKLNNKHFGKSNNAKICQNKE